MKDVITGNEWPVGIASSLPYLCTSFVRELRITMNIGSAQICSTEFAPFE